MAQPEVSVIVPVYNSEKCIGYCVDSMLNQDFENFELILINDGSRDSSGKICDSYAEKDSRIKVIHQKNSGVSASRNAGIEAASGKYIMFADSDDYVRNNFISTFLEAKKTYSDCNSIWSAFYTANDYSPKKDPVNPIKDQSNFMTSRDRICSLHQRWVVSMVWNKLFDRSIIMDNNIRMNTEINLGEDLLFVIDYLDKAGDKILFINKPLYVYVTGGGLLGNYIERRIKTTEIVNESLRKHYTAWGLNKEEMEKFYNSAFFRYESTLKNTFMKQNTASFSEKLRYNNIIMHSKQYDFYYRRLTAHMHPLYAIAYKTRNYLFVLLVDKLCSIKKKKRRS